MTTDDSRYRNLLVGKHEMGILALIGSGATVDDILSAGAWTLNDVTAVVKRYGFKIDEKTGQVVGVARTFNQLINTGLESPSPLVRRQAEKAHAQLLALGKALGMQNARDVSEALRREQIRTLNDWIYELGAMAASARDELARLRASSPRSTRARRVAS